MIRFFQQDEGSDFINIRDGELPSQQFMISRVNSLINNLQDPVLSDENCCFLIGVSCLSLTSGSLIAGGIVLRESSFIGPLLLSLGVAFGIASLFGCCCIFSSLHERGRVHDSSAVTTEFTLYAIEGENGTRQYGDRPRSAVQVNSSSPTQALGWTTDMSV